MFEAASFEKDVVKVTIFWTDDIILWTSAVLSPEQLCLKVCCDECKSYPQQQIQIESFDIRTVVLCNSGLGEGIILWTPQT